MFNNSKDICNRMMCQTNVQAVLDEFSKCLFSLDKSGTVSFNLREAEGIANKGIYSKSV